jgi:GNAT superfamily N-acetyltransferase
MKHPTVKDFLNGPHKNLWVKGKHLAAYLRKSVRCDTGKALRCIDIANVQVTDAKQGRGHFTAWYTEAEAEAKAAGFEAIYIENILSPRMENFCISRGFTSINVYGGALASYIKEINHVDKEAS